MTTLSGWFDPLRAAIGLFVVLGVALTALGVYVLLAAANVGLSADLAVSLASGVSLAAFAVLLTAWLHGRVGRQGSRRSV